MKRIDTARWKPSPDNPNKLIYDGQRTAQEVFEELRYRLESTGYVPDEYLLLDSEWENGKPFPKDADIFCTADYGASGGIYMDMYVKYPGADGKMVTKSFVTGKTLGEDESDLDRMFLIASACTKAFHTDGVHARYMSAGEAEKPKSAVIHLNEEEKQIVTSSLIDTRARLKAENKPFEKVEQLIRRFAGDILDFLKSVGERPQTIDEHDRAVLAIQDGNMDEFCDAFPKVPHVYGNLLAQAASRPDAIGKEMTQKLLAVAQNISSYMYLQAGKNAIDTGDTGRALMLLRNAPECVRDLDSAFYGDMILHALKHDEKHGGKKTDMAHALAAICTAEQLKDADPFLLKLAMMNEDRRLTNILIEKGIDLQSEPAMLFYAAAKKKDVELAEKLTQRGADINGQNYAALSGCMQTGDIPSAMFLLKCGADFDGFMETINDRFSAGKLSEKETSFVFAIKSFWENNIKPPALDQGDGEGEMEYGED